MYEDRKLKPTLKDVNVSKLPTKIFLKNRLCSEIIDFAFLIRVLARNENAKIFIVTNIILHFTYISLINPSISSPSFQAGLNLTPFCLMSAEICYYFTL